MYGHVGALAAAVAKGAAAAGADVKQYQFKETLPDALVKKLGGDISINPKFEIATAQHLEELDGFIIGAPTRYGRLPAQASAFLDSTGAQFASGSLVGKFASTFTSTNTQHGGQETTHLTTMPFFSHQGIIHVPIGFTKPYLADLSEPHGGSPYGASTLAGADGKRTPTKEELELAEYQGQVSLE
jgi:NAD(P)H dehydrogenase (quinone)